MKNKFGPYITKLMTTVKDFKEDQFVRDLAIDELTKCYCSGDAILNEDFGHSCSADYNEYLDYTYRVY